MSTYQLEIEEAPVTDEERLLLKKYTLLREKKEQVEEYIRQQEEAEAAAKALEEAERKKNEGSGSEGEGHEDNSSKENSDMEMEEEPAKDNRELAKELVLTGKISLAPLKEETKRSFKKAKVLERKLEKGQGQMRSKVPEKWKAIIDGNQGKGQILTPTIEDFEKPGTSSGSKAPVLSAAALAWRRSIEMEDAPNPRNRSSGGGYFDFKRRIVRYDDDNESGSDDEPI